VGKEAEEAGGERQRKRALAEPFSDGGEGAHG
jgi:hypothetical protein